MSEKPLKIIKLEAENVKRLKAVEITPKGDLVIVSGKNGQGKTSILDSIMYALGGEKTIPKKPIRDGESKAKITIDMGEFIVKRTCTQSGTYLTITGKDNVEYKSPQQMLDKLVGGLSFDPLDFIRMDGKQQVEILKDILKIDFTDLDLKYKQTFDTRTMLNREHASLKAKLGKGNPYPDIEEDKEEVSMVDLTNAYKKAQDTINKNNNQRHDLEAMRGALSQLKTNKEQKMEQVERLKAEIEGIMEEVKVIDADISQTVSDGKQLKTTVDKLVDPDITEITKEISSAETTNIKIRESKQWHKLNKEAIDIESKIKKSTQTLEKIIQDKHKQLENANMPIPGIAFNENGVTYQDIPFEQLCSSEQLKVSLAMGLAMNPKIRVILIRDGSLLDGDNLAVIKDIATKNDAQVWLERVDTSGKMGIVIEDGMVIKENKEE